MKRMLFLLILSGSLFCSLQVSAQIKHAKPAAATRAGKPILLNKPAPDFTLKNPDGNDIALSSFKGRYVLVDFWASWCIPCRAAIPQLTGLYQKYHAKGFDILSVSADADSTAWKKALAREQMPWQQVVDTYADGNTYGNLWMQYKIESVPFTILLDKTGKVIAINSSPAQIDKLLAARP